MTIYRMIRLTATHAESRKVQDLRESGAHLLLQGLGKDPQVSAKQCVVPCEYLVDQDVAVPDQPEDSRRCSHAQRERVTPDELRCGRQSSRRRRL